MAQTGYTPISIYYSATATNTPTAGNLVAGELAINTADGKLFYKDSSGVVQTIATKATAGLPTTTTGSGAIVLQTSPSITTPTISSGGANFSGSTSGTINLVATATAGSNTATLPAATGTVMVSGNMPAFSASLSTGQSITTSTNTKILFDVEGFDTNNNFASSRFTPTVAGYYQVNLMTVGQNVTSFVQSAITKNGSSYKFVGLATASPYVIVSGIVYLNGSTDYIEGYTYMIGTTPIVSTLCYFDACMIRSA